MVAIVAAPLSAHAATLVSNDGKSTSSTLADLEQRNFAQTFTTGAGEFGYAVESVELDFGTVPRSGITSVSLWTVASGTPSTKLVDLSNPASFSIGRNTFTAPTGTSLEKQTTYFVVITASGGTLRTTSSNSEDSSGQSDWSIGNNALEEIPDFNITWRERDNSLKIVVNGTVKTEDTDDTDATLSALSLQDSGGDPVALSPTFNSSAETYTAWVSNSVAAVALTATKNSSGATVVITGDDNLATAGSATLDLDEGANTLTVTVTAADTMTMKTYTVALVREASAPPADPNAIWTANLTVGSGGGTLGDPSFGYHRGNSFGALAPRAFTYNSSTVTVEEFAYNPIPPSPELPARTIMDFTGTLAGGDYVLHLGAMSFPFSYDAITTDLRIGVGSLDWNVGDVVLVKLGRPPNDATLSALGLEDGDGATVSLSPGFNRTTDSYTALVSDDVDEVTLTATQSNPGATVAITDDDDSSTPNEATFDYGGNRTTLTVTVTSSNGNRTRTYTVAVVRTSKEARLKGFWMADIGWLPKTPMHDPDTTAYVTSVAADVEELTLKARPLISGATAAVTGGPTPLSVVNRNDGTMSAKLDIPRGSTTWTVTVTSADGSETKTYDDDREAGRRHAPCRPM